MRRKVVRSITLRTRQVYIVPNRHGLVFALVLIVMLLGAINYSNSLAFLLTFLLTGLALASMIATYQNMVNLTLQTGSVNNVHVGDRVQFQIILKANQPRFAVGLKWAKKNPEYTNVIADSMTKVSIEAETKVRGLMTIPALTVFTEYPLGLFYAWYVMQFNRQCIIYPRPAGHTKFPELAKVNKMESGDQGIGADDFKGFRNFQPGDSPRHINWKAVARGQPLLTKQFGADESIELWFEQDCLRQLTTEAALSQLCLWILDASQQRLVYGLRLSNQEIAPATGEAHKTACLTALALYE